MHPTEVVYLEHDGKLLLVDDSGNGPQPCTMGRQETSAHLRFPSREEVNRMGITWEEERITDIRFDQSTIRVIHGMPNIDWPSHWTWKDEVISDNSVHPVAREAVYRSIHRLVSKVIIQNQQNEVLMAKVERGYFKGYWTLPGGYMNHSEEPAEGCVRETYEELGISVAVDDKTPIITQRSFHRDGISFMSFTYFSRWNGSISDLTLKEGEIAEARWFSLDDALSNAVSEFDHIAIESMVNQD